MAEAEMSECSSDAILAVPWTSIQETALVGPFTDAAAKVFARAQTNDNSTASGTLAPNFPISESAPTVDPEERALARNMTVGSLIEELSRNQTLSLFSNNRFL